MHDHHAIPAPTRLVVAGLLVAVLAQAAGIEVLRRVFVESIRGQWLDSAALAGNTIGEGYLEGLVDTVLNAVTFVSLAAATIMIGFIALMRGRVVLAAAAGVLIVGANVTAQLLKAGIERPDLGIDVYRVGAGNSLPSGHGTVAASVAVALVLVLPPRVRGAAALLGAGYAALTGTATMSADWHRPSDAVASLLVVGAWAALVGVVLAVAHRDDGAGRPQRAHRRTVTLLALAGALLLAVAVIAMGATYQALDAVPDPLELSRRRLLVAYAGGAAGIAAAAALVMAMVVATVHKVVPERGA